MTDTLKSICEQCTHLHNPLLEFLPDSFARQREIISRDLGELTYAASGGREKTVVILAGCIFESVLSCFIQTQIDLISARRGTPFNFDPEQSLGNYVNIFNKYFSDLGPLPDLIVEFRDIVHLNKELKYPIEVCQTAASDMLRLLDALLGSLGEWSRP